MVRECLLALVASNLAGCSLILDFSGPSQSAPDAGFDQAECDYKEPNDTIGAAALLDPTEVGPAAICSTAMGVDDHDFYKFVVPEGTAAVSIRITFVSTAQGDLDLKLTDIGGSTLGTSFGFGNEEVIACPGASPPCPMLAAGEYVFEVLPAQPGLANRYDLALAITPM